MSSCGSSPVRSLWLTLVIFSVMVALLSNCLTLLDCRHSRMMTHRVFCKALVTRERHSGRPGGPSNKSYVYIDCMVGPTMYYIHITVYSSKTEGRRQTDRLSDTYMYHRVDSHLTSGQTSHLLFDIFLPDLCVVALMNIIVVNSTYGSTDGRNIVREEKHFPSALCCTCLRTLSIFMICVVA